MMWIQEDEYFVRCSCGDTEYMLSFWFNQENFINKEKNEIWHRELFIHQRIDTETFWRRVKAGFKYIFKPKEILHHGEVSIDLNTPEGQSEARGLIDFLLNCLKTTKKKNK